MFTKKTIRDYDLQDKRILVRVDYNLPANDDGTIADDYRIKQSIPTLEYLLQKNCTVMLISHRGRPDLSNSDYDPATSMKPVAERLSVILGRPIEFIEDCVGDGIQDKLSHLGNGQIALLENLRYHDEEEQNSDDFASEILRVTGAEIFVQDGFGVVHRAHASTDSIARKGIPALSGLLLEKEVDTITNVINNPDRPLLVIVGGAKISDKIEILKQFIDISDCVAVVGALANTFLLALGHNIGSSLADVADVPLAKEIMEKAHQKSLSTRFSFLIPNDVVVANEMDNKSSTRIVDLSHNSWADITSYPQRPESSLFTVSNSEKILDIGPFSASMIAGAIKLSSTVVWNGTSGVTEIKGLAGAQDPFSHGTKIIVNAMVSEHGQKDHPFVVVGGGDTVGFVESQDGLRERLGHVSTGGGASLELMAGKTLPGVAVLWDRE